MHSPLHKTLQHMATSKKKKGTKRPSSAKKKTTTKRSKAASSATKKKAPALSKLKSTSAKVLSEKGRSEGKLASGNIKPVEAAQIQIHYLNRPYKFSKVRRIIKIHPRKILPKAPKGPRVNDMLPTPPLSLQPEVSIGALAEGRAMAITDAITLVKNAQLNDVATNDTASHVCEPSAAANGKVIFYTGNWFAAISIDGGTTFKYIDPYTSFPNPPGMEFCCDQVVHYIKSKDTFIWLLQYTEDNSGKNIQRIAYAKTAKVKTGTWKFFDIKPSTLGLGPGVWLDFPDLATGKNMLYMTTNCFKGENWVASAVVRIKLTSFTSDTLSASKAVSNTSPSLRVAQHCGTTAYFVSHNSTSQLRVFSWKEADPSPTARNITVASWADGPYTSKTPDGKDWLKRADSRHTGATLVANEVWFAWGSAKGGANARPHAFVQIARININTMTLIENVNLWDSGFATFYAGLSTNSNNEVGASYAIGGPTKFPTHVVGILTGTKRQVTTFTSTRGPSDNKWGDYLTVRRLYPNEKLFCAAGYSLQSGAGNSDATPNVTIFGRSSDV